jgi:hypothetical protein
MSKLTKPDADPGASLLALVPAESRPKAKRLLNKLRKEGERDAVSVTRTLLNELAASLEGRDSEGARDLVIETRWELNDDD